VEKSAPSKNFYAPNQSIAKSFDATRTFSPAEFAARHFRSGDSAANISSRSRLTKSDTLYITPAAPDPRTAAQSDLRVAGPDFKGSRPFLDRGKSQKALANQSAPMTIEQVRELLNKNK
jgi:hypothetical protein